MASSGVWELFVPDVGSGTKYKYQVLGADDVWTERADPMAYATERRRDGLGLAAMVCCVMSGFLLGCLLAMPVAMICLNFSTSWAVAG